MNSLEQIELYDVVQKLEIEKANLEFLGNFPKALKTSERILGIAQKLEDNQLIKECSNYKLKIEEKIKSKRRISEIKKELRILVKKLNKCLMAKKVLDAHELAKEIVDIYRSKLNKTPESFIVPLLKEERKLYANRKGGLLDEFRDLKAKVVDLVENKDFKSALKKLERIKQLSRTISDQTVIKNGNIFAEIINEKINVSNIDKNQEKWKEMLREEVIKVFS